MGPPESPLQESFPLACTQHVRLDASRGSITISFLAHRVLPNLHGYLLKCVRLRSIFLQTTPSNNSSCFPSIADSTLGWEAHWSHIVQAQRNRGLQGNNCHIFVQSLLGESLVSDHS